MKKNRYWYVIVLISIGSLFIALSANAAPFTYQYTGNYFNQFANNLSGHGDYDTTNRVEMTITTLDGPFVVGDNTANVASFLFYDGRSPITQYHTLTTFGVQIDSLAGLVPDWWIIDAISPIAMLAHEIGSVSRPGWELDVASIRDSTARSEDSGYIRGAPGTWTTTAASVPEPSTIILLGAGLLGLAGCVRKKFKK